ncbi:transcriptional regulator TetR family [Clostridium sp. CAG:575]|nr:transcriptional regulator TetR family [Clostridium sp. CAG:575]
MKKEQIIQSARELFHQFGFKKVSMDEIAQKAGVTKKTIYMYFDSKEDLLKYFIQEEIQNMEKIVKTVEEKNLDFFETVNQAIYGLLEYRKHQDFLNVIAKEAEWLKNPVIVDNLKLIDEKIQNYIRKKLEKAKENGYIDYPDLNITTFLVYKMYIALIIEWNDKDKNLDDQMIAQSIVEILKNGLRKDVEKNEKY